jgi:hypothetical protein
MAEVAIDKADPVATGPAPYVDWGSVVAGAIAAAAVSSVLMAFGTGIGLSTASPSVTWRDTSSALALLSGIWILLVALGSFALGGYLAGRMRSRWADAAADEIEFRDGTHGFIVWGLAIIIGVFLGVAAANVAASLASRAGGATPPSRSASTVQPFLALELDRLFRSDRRPPEGTDAETRAEAARIISAGLGRRDIAAGDRAYLARLVSQRTGLNQPDADRRTSEVIAQAKDAVSRVRRSAVIIAFMIAASLAVGAAAAWLAAITGGRHRDHASAPVTWWGRRRSTAGP